MTNGCVAGRFRSMPSSFPRGTATRAYERRRRGAADDPPAPGRRGQLRVVRDMPELSRHRRAYALDTIGDLGSSALADPERYPKRGRDYSAWLDDVYRQLGIATADVLGRVDGRLDRPAARDQRAAAGHAARAARPHGAAVLARDPGDRRPADLIGAAPDRRQARHPAVPRRQGRRDCSLVPSADSDDGRGCEPRMPSER